MKVVLAPGPVFCCSCGSVMYVGRYRQTEDHFTVECLAQHCKDRGSVFKLLHNPIELERREPTPTPQEPYK